MNMYLQGIEFRFTNLNQDNPLKCGKIHVFYDCSMLLK